MTDNPTTPEIAETEAPATEPDTPTTETPEDTREARKYRKRAQEAEAERDALSEQLTALRRDAIEQIAATAGFKKPDFVWAAGLTPEDVLTDDGRIDHAHALTRITELANEHGITSPLGAVAPLIDNGSFTDPGRSMAEVINPRR